MNGTPRLNCVYCRKEFPSHAQDRHHAHDRGLGVCLDCVAYQEEIDAAIDEQERNIAAFFASFKETL